MKLLLDTSMWEIIYTFLGKRELDVEWVGYWEKQPSDQELIAYALEQQKIIVILGEDLQRHIVAKGLPHYGILQLPARLTGVEQTKLCFRLLNACQRDLTAGGIVTFTENGISVRSPLLGKPSEC